MRAPSFIQRTGLTYGTNDCVLISAPSFTSTLSLRPLQILWIEWRPPQDVLLLFEIFLPGLNLVVFQIARKSVRRTITLNVPYQNTLQCSCQTRPLLGRRSCYSMSLAFPTITLVTWLLLWSAMSRGCFGPRRSMMLVVVVEHKCFRPSC